MGRVVLPVGAALTLASGVAMAQQSELRTDEITVWSGARDERRLLETPNAVTVIDSFEIERRQPSTYEELLGDVPGVVIEGGPRGISQEPNIRGFQDEQIVLRIDGARQNFDLAHRGRFFTDPEILSHVEVLRGGASSLFGSGALGGVILLDTKDADDLIDPGETWGGRVKAGYNSQGDQFLGALTLAARAGDFDVLGFYAYRPMLDDLTDGDGDPILNSEIDSMNGLVKLGYEPGDHRFEVSYQRYDDSGLTPPNANAAATPTTIVNRDLAFQTARGEWTWDPASALVDLGALVWFNAADVSEDRPFDARLDETAYRTLGLELVNRSEFDLGLPVRLSYGIEGYQDRQEATRNGAVRAQAPDARARYAAAFAQADIDLADNLTLTPGLRFDWYDVDPEGNFPDRTESELSPKLALQWRPTDGLQLWANASQSFRAPSLTELYNDGVHFSVPGFPLGPGGPFFTGNNVFIPTPDLEPERARQIEIGARWEQDDLALDGDRLTLAGNAYYARVDDFVDTVVSFIDFGTGAFNPVTGRFEVSGSTRNVNVDAELWGFEAEVDYDARDWFAGAGLSIPRGRALNGGALGSIPQDRLFLTGGVRPWRELEIGARATFLDGQDDVPAGTLPASGASVFDIFAVWSPESGPLEGAALAVGVDNVTDRDYRIHPNGLDQPGIAFKASIGYDF